MSSDSDSIAFNEVHAEFVTNITDTKYIQNGPGQYVIPVTIDREGLNKLLCQILSVGNVKFTFYHFGILIDTTLLDLLNKVDFNPESILTITYTLYDESKPEVLTSLNTWLTCIAYVDDSNSLAVSTSDGNILSVKFDEDRTVLNKKISEGEISSFDVKRYGGRNYLASVSSLGLVEVATISEKNPYSVKSRFKGHSTCGTSVKFGPGLHTLASSGHDKSIRIYSLEQVVNKTELDPIVNPLDERSICWGHSDRINAIAYNEIEVIKSISLDGTYRIWDVETSKCKHTFNLSRPPVCMGSLDNGHSLIGHINGLVTIYDEKSDSVVFDKRVHTRIVSDIKWCKHNENIFASCSNDCSVHVNDIRFPKTSIYTFVNGTNHEYIRCCCWIDDVNIAIGTSDGNVMKIAIQNLSS